MKFIDFFVHDILDYTMLSNSKGKFTKDITFFNIKVAVSEIITILEDKLNLKNITIEQIYQNFKAYELKSDSMRLQ